jgi:ribosomal protein L29
MAKDIQAKKSEEILKDISEKREALRLFRFGASGSKVKNVREGRNIRRAIAQGLTELSRRKLEGSR